MIKNLTIKNIAVIDTADVELGGGGGVAAEGAAAHDGDPLDAGLEMGI